MHLERGLDLAIIGGGPAALFAAGEALSSGLRPTVISDRFGGCMSMMGSHPLQSYPDELRFGGTCCDLNDYMPKHGGVTIDGAGYTRYISDCIAKMPIERISAKVTGFEPGYPGIKLHLSHGGETWEMTARRVCIATGLLPREPGAYALPGKTLTCFEAYRHLSSQPADAALGRHVVVVGSGNSAFQLALGYSRSAKAVTILANRWPGVFPHETDERFALRGVSQLTLERIAKSYRSDAACPFNPAGRRELSPISLHIYDELHPGPDHLAIDIDASRNLDRIPAICLRAGIGSGELRPLEGRDGMYRLCLPTDDMLVISAIGVRARLPDNPFSDLLDPHTGFVAHQHGQTPIREIFAVGACTGDPSINTMQRPMMDMVQ